MILDHTYPYHCLGYKEPVCAKCTGAQECTCGGVRQLPWDSCSAKHTSLIFVVASLQIKRSRRIVGRHDSIAFNYTPKIQCGHTVLSHCNLACLSVLQGPERRGMGGGGGGFRDRDGDADARKPYDAGRPVSKADQEDQWSRGRQVSVGLVMKG